MSNLDVSHDEIGYGVPQGTLALSFASMKTIWQPCVSVCDQSVLCRSLGSNTTKCSIFSNSKFGGNQCVRISAKKLYLFILIKIICNILHKSAPSRDPPFLGGTVVKYALFDCSHGVPSDYSVARFTLRTSPLIYCCSEF